MKIAQVIVDIPLMQTDKPFTYEVPPAFESQIEVGMRVHVPFGKGNRLLMGIVVGLEEVSQRDEELKPLAELLDPSPVLNEEQLYLADRLREKVFSYKITLLKTMLPAFLYSDYKKILQPTQKLDAQFLAKWFKGREQIDYKDVPEQDLAQLTAALKKGQVLLDYQASDRKHIKKEKWCRVDQQVLEQLALPKAAKGKIRLKEFLASLDQERPLKELKQDFSTPLLNYFIDQGALLIEEKEVDRSAAIFQGVEPSQALTLNEEQAQALARMKQAMDQPVKPILLEGITGSGKTEVYLQLIEEVLARGKTAIVLVPEISLTPQMTQRFIARFGQAVAILHSALSKGERYDQWRKIESGQAQVVVGARSAIFAPIKNLGAIIIDEEHEASYKQDANPRYHARDVALLRAEYNQALLILGSATPSLESRARASKGVYDLIFLTQRANPLAQIPQVEVLDFRDYIGMQEASDFTPPLLEAIQDRLDKKEQVVLMLNRRGYSSFVMCRDCAYVDNCPNCDISLTLHMDSKSMNCHYCGHRQAIPRVCPNCQSKSIRYYGSGTQKAAQELAQIFPQARILRMDMDTTRKKGAHEKMLQEFGRGDYDILIGTQMIAKGLDFPNVTLVGVLNADTALHLPDFRSSERTFQLLTQVAGRAGRAHKQGQVFIQTYNPDHYAITLAQRQDYEAFYAYEMGIRRMLAYPPYYFTVGITISDKDPGRAQKAAYDVLEILKSGLSQEVQFLGPTPKPIARSHGYYHFQILVKYRKEEGLYQALNQVLDLSQSKEYRNIRLSIDNEPQNLM